MKESAEIIERDTEVYKVLAKHGRLSILRYAFISPHGLFLVRIKTTLQDRVGSKTLSTARIRARRIRLVTSAMAWLEKIGYDQGDLRPPNILLMADDNIRTARELEEDEE